jgi:hypothetical protein
MINIGVKGKILKGHYEGWYIMVEPSEPTGSQADPYYIFYSSNFYFKGGFGQGYDNWVEDFKELEAHFR